MLLKGVFQSCDALTSVTISDGVTSIGKHAFRNCQQLTSFIIPKNVTFIGERAFCLSGLSSIKILNPDCYIYSDDYGTTIPNNAIIYRYTGSKAETYAERFWRTFIPLDDEPETFESEETTPTEEFSQGDASGDGKVDILDVITINRTILGKEKMSPAQLKAIDFNGNNKLDPEEAVTIMRYIVGLITSF